jgi:iron complex outermembrane receptor protein
MQKLVSDAGFPVPTGTVTDGRNRAFTLIMGSNSADAKGNVTAYFSYRSADPVSQGNRDFAACLLVERGNNAARCTGSINSNLFSAGVGLASEGDFSVVGNQLLPYPQANSVPPPVFNSSPYQYFSSQTSRYMGGLFAHYDLTDWAKPYLEFNYMNDKSSIQIAPSGMFYGGDPKSPVTFPAGSGPDGASAYMPCNSALFSAQEQSALAPFCGINGAPPGYVGLFIGRRNIEGGPRLSEWEHNNYRVVGGVKGDVTEAWNYDVYFSNYYTTLTQFNGGYLSYSAINNALNVGPGGTCLTGGRSCSPYQIFTQGGVTAAQAAALTTPATEGGFVRERIVSGSITGELGKYGVKSPLANDGIAINLGAEFRNDVLNFQPDAASLSNDLAGFSGASTTINNAKTSVTEEFAELRVPILQSAPWARELVFDTGYRHSNYTPGGGANTYKFELQYAPVQDVRFRGSFQRALRAPNVVELFNPQTVTNTSVVAVDPCAGVTPTASLADCVHSGVTPAQYGHIPQCPANQCATLTGGNPLLKPEIANTTSFGVTLTPTFLNNFEASIDFYRIIVKQEIAAIPLSTSFNQCLSTGDPTFCALVERSSSGALFGTTIAGKGFISGTAVNVANAEVRGVDIQSGYRVPLHSLGTLTFNLNGTYLANTTVTPLPGFGTFDCAGLYGATCASVNPRWRHNLRTNWQLPWTGFLVSAQWRYIGRSSLDSNSSNPLLSNGRINTLYAHVGSVNYLDLSAEWNVTKMFSLRAGINNILDKDPPVIPTDITGTGSGNVFASYDTLGREVFAGFTAKF